MLVHPSSLTKVHEMIASKIEDVISAIMQINNSYDEMANSTVSSVATNNHKAVRNLLGINKE